jgi:hypothetical protein
MADKIDLLGMSDDDILNMNGPPEVAEEAASTEDTTTTTETEATAEEETATAEASEASAEDASAGGEVDDEAGAEAKPDPTADLTDEQLAALDKPPEAKPEAKAEAKTEDKVEDKPEEKAEEKSDDKVEDIPIEAKAVAYNQIMAPFKANGKTIQLKSPEEAIALMQMGANYTKKLQELQPQRKLLLMLQNNGLLDEGKLSFLIDLDKKDPAAIQKLIKDSGIDPMDIDTSVEPAYTPGGHIVGDREANFTDTLGELSSTPEGKESIAVFQEFDDTSKKAIWEDPSVMTVLHAQRASGVYDLIKDEMERRMTLGEIPRNLPFLQAYKQVGDLMVAESAGGKGDGGGNAPAGDQAPQVVTTRPAKPKPTVANGDRATAASSTKVATKKAEAIPNPLDMSDEEFAKLDQFKGIV